MVKGRTETGGCEVGMGVVFLVPALSPAVEATRALFLSAAVP